MADIKGLEQRWRVPLHAQYLVAHGVTHYAGDFDKNEGEYITVCLEQVSFDESVAVFTGERTVTCLACLAGAL